MMRDRRADAERSDAPHVLLVEDDRDLQAALAERLASLGLRVTCVEDAVRGFLRTEVGDIDVVLLDLGLPSVHGLDFLSYLSESTDIPTVVLTGAEGDVLRRARELRPAGLLHKPARSRDLYSALRDAVGAGRSGKTLEDSPR